MDSSFVKVSEILKGFKMGEAPKKDRVFEEFTDNRKEIICALCGDVVFSLTLFCSTCADMSKDGGMNII